MDQKVVASAVSLSPFEDGHPDTPIAFSREQCMEFAVGSIANVLGHTFAEVDTFPTRVRLPAEPLMLVDRILNISGEPRSLTSGNLVTEHDVLRDGWYLDNGRIPSGVAIESGQADLFLSGYLGIDFRTRGLAVYRLLDATVTFHDSLPQAGETIQHDIHIDQFFQQGDTYLFRFRFESTVDGKPLLSMRDGCAGFFTPEELAAGKGLVQRSGQSREFFPSFKYEEWQPLVPVQQEAYSEQQVESLRQGDLAGCFGKTFGQLSLKNPLALPSGLLKVVQRVVHLDPGGGNFQKGMIRGEQDVDPQAWFLTCHFVDDQVMPGTLMYECCLHTFRIYLLRLGWVAEAEEAHFEPVPGVAARLRCRGQVIASTRVVTYEIHVKFLGYRPEPFATGDAYLYADGKPIVEITDVSLQLTGVTQEKLQSGWQKGPFPALPKSGSASSSEPIFDRQHILAFAVGKPSEAFGEEYKIFDGKQRRLARLPGPPYSFLDRVTRLEAEPWKMQAGGVVETEYDIPPNAWYFRSNGQPEMPFAVLLEVALQTCGWLAAYMGSALLSPVDMRFRNLGGEAEQLRPVTNRAGTLINRVKVTRVSHSGGMIIQHYDFCVLDSEGDVYRGSTYFGFFSDAALAQQIGIREGQLYKPTREELRHGRSFPYPIEAPFPDRQFRMVDQIGVYVPDGGPSGLGFIEGSIDVDPDAWFFKAHFFQDPVWPGSLGLEALWQLLKVVAWQKFSGTSKAKFLTPCVHTTHQWVYRGQVIPNNSRVTIQAIINRVDQEEQVLSSDGWLAVDGLVIYQMKDFSIQLL